MTSTSLTALAAQLDLSTLQLDILLPFNYGDFKTKIFIQPPSGIGI